MGNCVLETNIKEEKIMKKLFSTLLCILMLNTFVIGGLFSQSANAAVPSVRIAFVFDGESPANSYFLENLKK